MDRERREALESTDNYKKFRALNAGLPPNEIVLREGIRLKICPEAHFSFEHFCFRHDEMVMEYDFFLQQIHGRKRLLDVGALHGIFSLTFTSRGEDCRSVAVDPSPKASPFLLYNMHANPKCSIKYVEMALSDTNEDVLMIFKWQHLNAVRVAAEGDEAIVVRGRRGDDLCRELNYEPDTIKIDVEGFELHCLRGLTDTIERLRPLVFVELHAHIPDLGSNVSELITICRAHKYHAVDSHNRRLSDDDIRALDGKLAWILLRPDEIPD
jgi:FkbM family methyltransferase